MSKELQQLKLQVAKLTEENAKLQNQLNGDSESMTPDTLNLINEEELALVDNNALNAPQLDFLLKRTPKSQVKKRPGKGGGEWEYVKVGYMIKVLNYMFGWDWDFEIIKDNYDMCAMGTVNEMYVLGKLTCRSGGREIVKMQYGNKDVTFKKEGGFLSLGNDLKAAASDALKKCASKIGIAADIYNKNEFKEVRIDVREERKEALLKLINEAQTTLKLEDIYEAHKKEINQHPVLKGAVNKRNKELNETTTA